MPDRTVVVADPSRLQARCLTEVLGRSGVKVDAPVSDLAGLRLLLDQGTDPAPLVLLGATFAGADALSDLVADITAAGHPCLVLLAGGPTAPLPLLEAGALGFVPDDTTDENLLLEVQAALRGEACIPRATLADILRSLIERRRAEDATHARYRRLSRREREVLALLANGHTAEEIAARLVISPHTVRSHLGSALNKLGARSQAEAVRLVHEHGLHDRGGGS